jgi:SulP family sulfate permease
VLQTLVAVLNGLQHGSIRAEPVALVVLILIVLRLWRPLNRRVPGMLVAVVIGSFAALGIEQMALSSFQFSRVGAIPSAIPPFSLPDLRLSTIQQLFGAVLVMVLLASTEAMAIARAMALKTKDRFDANQEFVGQGLANIGGAFFSAFPASGSFNRSGVNYAANAKTPLSAISASVFLVMILLFVSPLALYLPYVAISALLLAVAWNLIDTHQIRHEIKAGPREWVPMVVTALATVLISLEWAILLGICVALVAKKIPASRPR